MSQSNRTTGRKRRFLFYGALNVAITNIVLQLLLLLGLPTVKATFISQVFNVFLGFFLYGKKVFRIERLQKKAAMTYGMLAIVLWAFNWGGIELINFLGPSRNLAALIMIPFLAAVSYFSQKYLIFAKRPGSIIFNN